MSESNDEATCCDRAELRMGHRQRHSRWPHLIALLGGLSLPLGAWAFDPNWTAFEANQPIRAQDMNDRFEAIQQAIASMSNTAGNVPIGTIVTFAGATAPTDWLLCDGSEHLSADYPELAAVLHPGAWGGASDSQHFLTPNLIDRFPLGVPAARLGELGGQSMVALGGTHSHTGSTAGTSDAGYVPGVSYANCSSSCLRLHSHPLSIDAGGEHSHGEHVPPYTGVSFIIRAR